MMNMLTYLQHGFGLDMWTLTFDRVLLGLFFSISGFHKLFNKTRHASLVNEFKSIHIPLIGFNQWWVPSVEFFGGLALISGLLAPLAASGLIVVCLVATCSAGVKRIPSYKPIDKADWLDDLLYLPEVLYIIGLIMIVDLGPGHLTVLDLISNFKL